MKHIRLLVYALLLSILSFTFISPTNENIVSPVSPNSGMFLLGAMDNQTDWNRQYITKQDKFGMNVWSCYGNGSTYNLITHQHMPLGWDTKDSVNADSSVYFDIVKVFLNKNAGSENIADTLHSLMSRPKITWLCYGQRSDYQCESQYIDDYYWLYSFQIHEAGTPIADSGGYVQYCQRNPNQTDGGAGWVVKRLKANTEQNTVMAGTSWIHWDDSEHGWV